MFVEKRYAEKALKETLAMHEESSTRHKVNVKVHDEALPACLLDCDTTTRAEVLSNTIKQKRKEKAGKWDVPQPKVRPVAEDENGYQGHICGARFYKKTTKIRAFIHPTGLQFTKGHVTHPELKCTFNLDIIGIKKNTNGPMYTSLGVVTKGTIIEVNVSELGLAAPERKVVWGKYAQVTDSNKYQVQNHICSEEVHLSK